MRIYVDADGCPVKEEVYRVARRFAAKVYVVANASLRVPKDECVELVVVRGDFNAADDWIVEHVAADDVVITIDIPLAERCLEKKARVLGHKGNLFKATTIGSAMANRELANMLRQLGELPGGPPPFTNADRSRFLSKLDETLHAVKRIQANPTSR